MPREAMTSGRKGGQREVSGGFGRREGVKRHPGHRIQVYH